MRTKWKILIGAISCLFILAGFFRFFSSDSPTRPAEKEVSKAEFALESLTMNGVEYQADKLEFLSIPKSVDLKVIAKYRSLTNKEPRESGLAKIIKIYDGVGPVIVQSASGSITKSGKSSKLTVQFRIPDDTKIGECRLSFNTMGTPIADVPCKIVNKP